MLGWFTYQGINDIYVYVYMYVHKINTYIYIYMSFGYAPHSVTITTRIIISLVRDPHEPSFATVTGWGVDPIYLNCCTNISHQQ